MRTLCATLALAVASGHSLPAADAPLGHWPLRDGSGQTVRESVRSHKAFLGVSSDADGQDPKWVNGRLVFDGVNDCVTVGAGADFVLTEKGTLAGWVKLDEAFGVEGSVVIKPSNWYFVINAARQPQFIYYTIDVFSGLRTCIYLPGRAHLPSDRWLHVAVTFGARAIRHYVNGRLDSSRLFEDEVLVATPRDVRIGCEATEWRPFKGSIAGVSIYDRTLAAHEVAEHMRRTDPRTEAERLGAVEVQSRTGEQPGDTSGIQW